MQRLSVKDFIKFLSPCFSCGGRKKILFTDKDREFVANILDNKLFCDISINYANKRENFNLDLNSSQLTNNCSSFFKKKIWIILACNKCGGYSSSSAIELKKINGVDYLSFIEIYIQSYSFKFKGIEYYFFLDKRTNSTTISLDLSNGFELKHLDLPFTTTMHFKTKEKVVEKVNRLLAFV
jgi:hypothetical protein